MHALYAHIISGLLIVLLPFLALVIKVANPAIMGWVLVVVAPFIAMLQNTIGITRGKYDILTGVVGILLIFMSYFAK